MTELPSFSTITLQQQGEGAAPPWFGRLFAEDGVVEAWADSPEAVLAELGRRWVEQQKT